MRIRKIDRKIERHILIGMIVNTNYLSYVSTKIEPEDLKNKYASTIAGWCLDYFEKYHEAPGREIEKIYEYHNRKFEVADNEVDLIEKLLEQVSDEYSMGSEINVDFLLDKTEEYLKRNSLEEAMNQAEEYLLEGNVRKAEEELLELKPVQITSADGIDPLGNMEKLESAFSQTAEPLFKVDGAFGELINEHLTRDSFLCFQAPEKAGKTWLLYWLALKAIEAGKRVALFQLGDMTETQSIIRLGILLCNKSNKAKYCGKFIRPKRFKDAKGEARKTAPPGYDIDYYEENIETPLTAQETYEAYNDLLKRSGRKDCFRMFTRPADTMTFTDIDSELDRLEKQEGFVADVVVADYMDLASCEERSESERAGVNKIWKKAKSLDNKRHILLISATQADAGTYGGELQSRGNYSEDKRKYSHVNAMIGMSQSDAEKKDGVMKYNVLVAREGEYVTSSACYVLQSFRTGEPVVDSVFATVADSKIASSDTRPRPRRKKQENEEEGENSNDNNRERNRRGSRR